jgi:RNA polymerase sigma-70 factor (ECF subfamily)
MPWESGEKHRNDTTFRLWYKYALANPICAASANFPGGRVSFTVSADDDLALVERCLRGETAAFRPLVERYQKLLFTVALRMLGDREEATDAAQNAFVRAYVHLASYDHGHKFFSWLYRILVNECLNVRRSRRPLEPIDPAIAGSDDPQRGVRRAELRAKVQAALMQLPRTYREVVVLRHFADLSYQEIAETLRVPGKTVKSRLYSARQQLGQVLLGWKDER